MALPRMPIPSLAMNSQSKKKLQNAFTSVANMANFGLPAVT